MECSRMPHAPGTFHQHLRLGKIFFRPVHSQPEGVSLMVVGSEFLAAKLPRVRHLSLSISSAGFYSRVLCGSEAAPWEVLCHHRNEVTGTNSRHTHLDFSVHSYASLGEACNRCGELDGKSRLQDFRPNRALTEYLVGRRKGIGKRIRRI